MDDPEKFPFNKLNVEDAPADSGVYALYRGRETIYAGKAVGDGVTIRSCLQSHLRGTKGSARRRQIASPTKS
jgi:excinuclease UvrABC nuclease subunit